MVKLFSFARRKPGLSREEFLRSWRDAHAPLMLREPVFRQHVRRFVINVAVSDAAIPVLTLSEFDGAAELWFDSLDDLRAVLDAPELRATSATSTASFVDPSEMIRLAADESVQFDRGFGNVKFIGLSRRHPSMSHDEWCRYWIDVHGPLAHGIPEFTRYYGKYVHNYVLSVDHASLAPVGEYDGIVEEWLESAEDMAACLAEPKYLELVRPDEVKFVDFAGSHMLLAEEHVVFEA